MGALFFIPHGGLWSAYGKGWKNAIVTWYQKFKESVFFRKLFLLEFVTSMILFRTLLNRNLWMNPLSNVMGGWGILETVNGEQKLTTQCIENVIMMMPFSAMVLWTFGEKIGNSSKKILWQSGCKNRHPSPICTQFEHHFHVVKPHLHTLKSQKPYNWSSTAEL